MFSDYLFNFQIQRTRAASVNSLVGEEFMSLLGVTVSYRKEISKQKISDQRPKDYRTINATAY